ncbi:hypothetical protein A3Q56_03395 [Intoshia linei]|uniref:Dynein regulatory complex subunit 4 n=1 Tax=Intoshia linei TaxID=1819745 RepID=A0A177B3Y0_9BILA|nr:hypothetical protein A3Q56_03395 [Intoshia linei]
MAPKKKGKKAKKGAVKNNAVVIDGTSAEDMTREQFEEHIIRLREELDREREERNYFQLERDKINTFWEITKRQLEEKRAELRNKDREMEDAEERHQVEIKVYKQKVKHLLYEHQNSISELKAENVVSAKVLNEECRNKNNELYNENIRLKINLREKELSNQNVMKTVRLNNDERLTKLRDEFEQKSIEIEKKYIKKMQVLREDLEINRKSENHEIEERKNNQINTLMKNHEKAFSDIKNYYNDITLNNIALINSLKEQVDDMKKKEDRLEKKMSDVLTENRKLAEPLSKAKEQLDDQARQLANYTKDKQSLFNAKARERILSKQIKSLRWEHEVLEQRFEKANKERDELYNRFIMAISEVQQKTGFKNLILERKLGTLGDVLEKKEAQLNEVLSSSNLDPSAFSTVTQKLEDVLDSKNSAIRDLQYELARVCKAHNDVIKTYEAKLLQYGIPVEELGFKPLETKQPKQKIGTGPAGLISAHH